ncbi:MAG: regulatory protein TetR [Actinomycetia bacterium]|nr:regulatory protein TetR [Actinomycetes bacterium]
MSPLGADPAPRAEPRRPRRADARRNYELLLAAAKEIFDEHGVDAPLDDIARRAGVGNATMYRHFPTRRELIIAVYADEVTALCAQGEALLEEGSPGDALFGWLRAFIAHVATKRELALAVTNDRGGQRSALFGRWHEAMHSTASALLTRAQRSTTVRADLEVSDLLALANGIALTGADADQTERLLLLIRSGTDPDPKPVDEAG